MNNEQKQPLSTHGSTEQEDLLGGTTNLSLDQLRKEGNIANLSEDNTEDLDNQDNLDKEQDTGDTNETNQNELPHDGGPANPAELNS